MWNNPVVQKQVEDFYKNTEPVPENPYEFEHYVARILKRNGRDSRTSKGSGDQGADIIAEKGKIKLVVQCKKYKKSVGNKAVQEVHAAKTHFNADIGIVVNSSGKFTKSAKELASSSGILLMHPNDLTNWSP